VHACQFLAMNKTVFLSTPECDDRRYRYQICVTDKLEIGANFSDISRKLFATRPRAYIYLLNVVQNPLHTFPRANLLRACCGLVMRNLAV